MNRWRTSPPFCTRAPKNRSSPPAFQAPIPSRNYSLATPTLAKLFSTAPAAVTIVIPPPATSQASPPNTLPSNSKHACSIPRDRVKVEIQDPLAAHRELLDKLTQADVHNLFAYLASLK